MFLGHFCCALELCHRIRNQEGGKYFFTATYCNQNVQFLTNTVSDCKIIFLLNVGLILGCKSVAKITAGLQSRGSSVELTVNEG